MTTQFIYARTMLLPFVLCLASFFTAGCDPEFRYERVFFANLQNKTDGEVKVSITSFEKDYDQGKILLTREFVLEAEHSLTIELTREHFKAISDRPDEFVQVHFSDETNAMYLTCFVEAEKMNEIRELNSGTCGEGG